MDDDDPHRQQAGLLCRGRPRAGHVRLGERLQRRPAAAGAVPRDGRAIRKNWPRCLGARREKKSQQDDMINRLAPVNMLLPHLTYPNMM